MKVAVSFVHSGMGRPAVRLAHTSHGRIVRGNAITTDTEKSARSQRVQRTSQTQARTTNTTANAMWNGLVRAAKATTTPHTEPQTAAARPLDDHRRNARTDAAKSPQINGSPDGCFDSQRLKG